jgi:hypothetical protein
MTGPQRQNATTAQLPEPVLRLQGQIESMFLQQKALEREVLALRSSQPVLLCRPPRPGLPVRVLLRLSRRLRRRHHLRLLQGCGLFDAAWYLETYDDVAEAGVDPLRHFLEFGGPEHRSPGPHFDTDHYLHLYPDIVEIGMNPLLHYVISGYDEKRSIRPGMPHGEVS